MNAANISPLGIKSSPLRQRSHSAKVADRPESQPPSDSVTLGHGEEAGTTKSLGKQAANILSFLTITSGIVVGAATGMVALPAALIGIGVVSGAMALDKNEGSKFSAWMHQREAKFI